MNGFWMFLAGTAQFIISPTFALLEVQDDDYDLIIYEDSKEVLFDEAPEFIAKSAPEFITKNSTLFVDLGGSITLPCQVKHEEYFTRIWKRKNEQISLGNSVLSEVWNFKTATIFTFDFVEPLGN